MSGHFLNGLVDVMLENRWIEEIEAAEGGWNINGNLVFYEGHVFSQCGEDGFFIEQY